jgi:AAA+ superfamily predicted ATPase
MAIFYTSRKGFKRGEKTIENAMKKAMDKDTIIVNSNSLKLEQTIMLKNGVTLSGDPDRKRPVLDPKERQPAFMIGANVSGVITLRHLDIQLSDSALGLRCNAKRLRLILDDVRVYHRKGVTTPYNGLVLDTEGQANVELNNCVIDLMQADVNSITLNNSNIGDWFVDNSKIIATQCSFEKSALQNILVAGRDKSSQARVRGCAIGGNTRFDNMQVSASDLALTQLPVINHRSDHGNQGGDATSLIVGDNTRFEATHLSQIDPAKQDFKTNLELPKYRSLGLVGGSLTIDDAYLSNTGLKNVARSGDLTFENVTDDSQWQHDPQVKLSNRNSHSQLFDSQSKLNITGNTKVAGEIKKSRSALEELDRMIGLKNVKSRLKQIIAQAKMNAERRKRGLSNNKDKLNLSLVFAGSPGTGKTVVARLVGQALYEAGVLRSTKFVEARQADLVGKHVGETAPKTKEVVRSALDGVLFIDEAYELAPPKDGGNTFNDEAVTELIADMENYSDRLVVIMAGYTEDMSDLFRRGNKGLASRNNNWVEFPDYTPIELKKIERLKLEDSHARLANAETMKVLDKGIDTLLPVVSRQNTAGNGRFIRNYVQKVTEMRDTRLAQNDTSQLTDDQLLIIQPQDVDRAVQSMLKQAQDMQQ